MPCRNLADWIICVAKWHEVRDTGYPWVTRHPLCHAPKMRIASSFLRWVWWRADGTAHVERPGAIHLSISLPYLDAAVWRWALRRDRTWGSVNWNLNCHSHRVAYYKTSHLMRHAHASHLKKNWSVRGMDVDRGQKGGNAEGGREIGREVWKGRLVK